MTLVFRKIPHAVSFFWIAYLGYNVYRYGLPEQQLLITEGQIYFMQIGLAVVSLFIFSRLGTTKGLDTRVSVADFLALSSFISVMFIGKMYPDTASLYLRDGIAATSLIIAAVNLLLVKSAFR